MTEYIRQEGKCAEVRFEAGAGAVRDQGPAGRDGKYPVIPIVYKNGKYKIEKPGIYRRPYAIKTEATKIGDDSAHCYLLKVLKIPLDSGKKSRTLTINAG
jgi:hypothetical protein